MTAAALTLNGRVTLSLAKRGLRQALRRPQFLAPLVIFPSLMLAANTGGAGRATELPGFPEVRGFLDFELAGAMMQSTMLAGVSGGIALALDFEIGFIARLCAAPISRYSTIAGREPPDPRRRWRGSGTCRSRRPAVRTGRGRPSCRS